MPKAFAGIAALALAFSTLPPASARGESVARALDRTVALDAGGVVSIKSHKGSVQVETWDEPRAQVSARVAPDTSCGTDAYQQERVDRTRIDFESTPSRLELHSNYDRLEGLEPIRLDIPGLDGATCSAHPFVHYRLRIPATARLEIEDHKSKIDVAGLRGATRISSHKGDVDVKAQAGGLDLTTHKGEVRVEFARLAADSRLTTHKGDIEVAVPRRAGFDLDARLERGGNFDTSFDIARQTDAADRRGRVYEEAINGGGPRLELSTHKGSLRLMER